MKRGMPGQSDCIASPEEAQALLAAVERTLERDLKMIASGERRQSDLHAIRPKTARHSKVRWTKDATVDFRR